MMDYIQLLQFEFLNKHIHTVIAADVSKDWPLSSFDIYFSVMKTMNNNNNYI